MKSVIATVKILSCAKALDREYDYLCPAGVPVWRGAVVRVPFGKGNRESFAVVTGVREDEPDRALKAILSVADSEISLTPEAADLCRYLQEQLFCTFGDAAKAILPSPVYRREKKTVRGAALAPGVDPDTALDAFRGKNKDLYQKILSHLDLTGTALTRSLEELFGVTAAVLSTMEKKGWIRFLEIEQARDPFAGRVYEKAPISLSDEQLRAFEQLSELYHSSLPAAALLHGVTGSGKTMVMLALCDEVIREGKSVIFLVPEIALTSQSAEKLFSRYADRVAVIHSGLSDGERRDAYLAVSRGEKTVVLGTRSAVFAPVKNLGLIVMDEEQDASYKSDTMLKYHARDVARFRCAKNGAMLLFASATPDVETYYKAKTGKYRLVEMTSRYGPATLPEVSVVDLRRDKLLDPKRLIGKDLAAAIEKNLLSGEQTILLMNRRGYRQFLSCASCGEVIRCPNCSVSLTLHNGKKPFLSCHYCGFTLPVPSQCPACRSEHLISHGYGIQQLEEELRERFPDARVLRLDSDSASGKFAHEKILAAFRDRGADILIGTQMVAKGHNFPRVTLVGVVMADSSLYLSDYRAAEHAFSLMTQVIGRAGRAEKKGRAIIQTLNPRHNLFSLASNQDYKAFYEGEIALRRAFLFPPFCDLACFTLSDSDEPDLLLASKRFADRLKALLKNEFFDVKLVVYGPFEAPVYKLKNTYRKRFVFKYKNNRRTRELFEALIDFQNKQENAKTKLSVDINPGMI